MRFHPVIAIILGIISYYIFGAIEAFTVGNLSISFGILLVLSGFVSTFLAKDIKVRYGIYTGLCLVILINLTTIIYGMPVNIFKNIVIAAVLSIIFGGIGGILAVFIDKNLNKKNQDITE